jgi:phosphoserine/homoserine phosphotransferase
MRGKQKGEYYIMFVTCLDLEGVLVPEIWIAFAEATGIPELKKTTRDEPDYDKLMNYRIGILKEHGLGLREIQDTIATIDPLPGAKEFLDKLRAFGQVIIISDTFSQFAGPLMAKLGMPTIFCNELIVSDDGEITGYKMRCEKSKLTTVKALQSCGFETIASGDSFNDLAMIEASKAGFLFRTTDAIKKDYPQYPAFEEYDDLYNAIVEAQK